MLEGAGIFRDNIRREDCDDAFGILAQMVKTVGNEGKDYGCVPGCEPVLHFVNGKLGKAVRYDEHLRQSMHVHLDGIFGHPADKQPFRPLLIK